MSAINAGVFFASYDVAQTRREAYGSDSPAAREPDTLGQQVTKAVQNVTLDLQLSAGQSSSADSDARDRDHSSQYGSFDEYA